MSIFVSGTITTQNLNPNSGVPTTGSVVELVTSSNVGNASYLEIDTVIIQVTGTYTGALTPQYSIDGTNWLALSSSAVKNIATDAVAATIASAAVGGFRINIAGLRYFRLSANAAVTGSAVVSMQATEAGGAIDLVGMLPTGTSTIGAVNLGTGGTGATSLGKAEDAAHATGDTGVATWGVRYEALTAPASAAGDYAFKQVDDLGKLVNMPFAPPINQLQGITAAMTATADTAVLAAAGASVRNYVTGVHVTNTHATVGTEVQIKDGSTILDRFYVPALSERTREYPTPLKGTANTAVNAANVTTGSNTYVQAVGFKAL